MSRLRDVRHRTWDMRHGARGWDVEALKGDGVEVKYRIYESLGAVKRYLGNPEGIRVSRYTGFSGSLRGYLGIYLTSGGIYGVKVRDLWGLGKVYEDQGEGTLSYLDIWDTPEPLNESLQEAINTIWKKLSKLGKGMRPPWEPLS